MWACSEGWLLSHLLWSWAGPAPCGTEETGSERDLACPGLHTTGCFPPTGYTAPYLTVFSENALDVFDVRRAEWVQTVPLKKVKVSPDRGSGAVGDMA